MPSYFLLGALTVAIIVLYFIASFLTCYAFWILAQEDDVFFTVIKEGYTKAIMKNGEPVRLIMRSAHHRFRSELGDKNGHEWDIIPYMPPAVPAHTDVWFWKSWNHIKKWLSLVSGAYLFENLIFVGFPPAHTVYRYSFHWSSRVQDPKGAGMIQRPREEIISHILAPQQEVYSALVEEAKTEEMIPVNASIALTIQIVNPYKALFSTHQWLKTVINQIEPDVREVIGRYTYTELTETGKTASNELERDRRFKKRCAAIEEEYGVKIVLAQFRSIEPAGKLADEITKISIQEYTAVQKVKVAEQEARAIDILADATERRLRKELGVVTNLGSDAVEIRKMELLPKNLQVYGNAGVMPTIPLAGAAAAQSEKIKKGE